MEGASFFSAACPFPYNFSGKKQDGEGRSSKMLTIIEIEAREDGCHGIQSQSHRTQCWLPGWVAVPRSLEQAVWDSGGYCRLELDENGALAAVTPTEKPPEPVPEPTAEERLRADVDYLAAMSGVDL